MFGAFKHGQHIVGTVKKKTAECFHVFIVSTRLCPLASSDISCAGADMLPLQQRFEAYRAKKKKSKRGHIYICRSKCEPEEPLMGPSLNDCDSQDGTDTCTLTCIKQRQRKMFRHQHSYTQLCLRVEVTK